jgi:TonB family protein
VSKFKVAPEPAKGTGFQEEKQMLDRLVESKNHSRENRMLNNLFGGALSLAAIALVFAFIISLYSFELNLGAGELEISSLTMPVTVEETPPEPQKLEKQTTTETVKSDVPTRTANILRLDETPTKTPDNVSVTPSKTQARPNVPFSIGKVDTNPVNPNGLRNDGNEGGKIDGSGIQNNTSSLIEKDEKEEIPVIKQEVKKVEPIKTPPVVSGGVVNGKAKYLAQPTYPQAAKQVRAGGKVEVQVMIDETGRVVSANVLSGNPLLRDAAVNAARKSIFAPTKLSDVPVKVSGVIVYNFNL